MNRTAVENLRDFLTSDLHAKADNKSLADLCDALLDEESCYNGGQAMEDEGPPTLRSHRVPGEYPPPSTERNVICEEDFL